MAGSGVGAGVLARDYAAARREAEILAGGTGDLAQRALAYHHLFRHSGGHHAFPLLAAHGALWARGYFAWGARAGAALSLGALHRPALRRARLAGLAGFAEAFRAINRRVFVEVYASYRFTLAHGERAGAEAHVDPVLLDALNRCHHAGRRMTALGPDERAHLFEAFFRWEQRMVVAPGGRGGGGGLRLGAGTAPGAAPRDPLRLHAAPGHAALRRFRRHRRADREGPARLRTRRGGRLEHGRGAAVALRRASGRLFRRGRHRLPRHPGAPRRGRGR
ncbi:MULTISPECIES: hypothetical protein [Methylobacterium]|uniref:Uncharacterized protein n=1 Tax=Methylobacterium ajmalii TaxID=2738439 RepID=A0ABV0A4Q1_9HYPH|nr:hypothetical protein [Methylobacterium aquaticum]